MAAALTSAPGNRTSTRRSTARITKRRAGAGGKRRRRSRLPNLQRESELLQMGFSRIAGVDEAGRGPLAGPVVAAAVVLPPAFKSPTFRRLNDSKQLHPDVREVLYAELTAAVPFGVGTVEADIIDQINIRQASWCAMQLAVAGLEAHLQRMGVEPDVDYLLIDGLGYGAGPWPYEAIIRGDSLSVSIAAASVIAKVTRDRKMHEHDLVYPQYGFTRHKGYYCPEHVEALNQHGPCPLHRRSFSPIHQCAHLTEDAEDDHELEPALCAEPDPIRPAAQHSELPW